MDAAHILLQPPEEATSVPTCDDQSNMDDLRVLFDENSPCEILSDVSIEEPAAGVAETDLADNDTRTINRKPRKAGTQSRSLGKVLQKRRHELGLTQRQLAARVQVQSAHIAYLEGDRRRPSLSLLNRISRALGLDQRELFALAHPEAKPLFRSNAGSPTPAGNAAWTEFKRNKALLVRNRVQPRELEILAQVNLLGKVSAPRNYLFILNAIRQAVDEE